jgi:competence protein ComEA
VDWLRAQFREAVSASGKSSGPLFVAIFVIVLLAAGAITLSTSKASNGTVGMPSTSPSATTQIDQPALFVHVVGAVKVPGIYKLEVGSRVVDAVFAAGGFLDEADQTSLNLARELSDGEQLFALKVGEQPSGSQGSVSSLISLNRASQAELEELPGVGPALAGRLIDWRNANGGFKSKEDLLGVSGIGQKLFESIKGLVTL